MSSSLSPAPIDPSLKNLLIDLQEGRSSQKMWETIHRALDRVSSENSSETKELLEKVKNLIAQRFEIDPLAYPSRIKDHVWKKLQKFSTQKSWISTIIRYLPFKKICSSINQQLLTDSLFSTKRSLLSKHKINREALDAPRKAIDIFLEKVIKKVSEQEQLSDAMQTVSSLILSDDRKSARTETLEPLKDLLEVNALSIIEKLAQSNLQLPHEFSIQLQDTLSGKYSTAEKFILLEEISEKIALFITQSAFPEREGSLIFPLSSWFLPETAIKKALYSLLEKAISTAIGQAVFSSLSPISPKKECSTDSPFKIAFQQTISQLLSHTEAGESLALLSRDIVSKLLSSAFPSEKYREKKEILLTSLKNKPGFDEEEIHSLTKELVNTFEKKFDKILAGEEAIPPQMEFFFLHDPSGKAQKTLSPMGKQLSSTIKTALQRNLFLFFETQLLYFINAAYTQFEKYTFADLQALFSAPNPAEFLHNFLLQTVFPNGAEGIVLEDPLQFLKPILFDIFSSKTASFFDQMFQKKEAPETDQKTKDLTDSLQEIDHTESDFSETLLTIITQAIIHSKAFKEFQTKAKEKTQSFSLDETISQAATALWTPVETYIEQFLSKTPPTDIPPYAQFMYTKKETLMVLTPTGKLIQKMLSNVSKEERKQLFETIVTYGVGFVLQKYDEKKTGLRSFMLLLMKKIEEATASVPNPSEKKVEKEELFHNISEGLSHALLSYLLQSRSPPENGSLETLTQKQLTLLLEKQMQKGTEYIDQNFETIFSQIIQIMMDPENDFKNLVEKYAQEKYPKVSKRKALSHAIAQYTKEHETELNELSSSLINVLTSLFPEFLILKSPLKSNLMHLIAQAFFSLEIPASYLGSYAFAYIPKAMEKMATSQKIKREKPLDTSSLGTTLKGLFSITTSQLNFSQKQEKSLIRRLKLIFSIVAISIVSFFINPTVKTLSFLSKRVSKQTTTPEKNVHLRLQNFMYYLSNGLFSKEKEEDESKPPPDPSA